MTELEANRAIVDRWEAEWAAKFSPGAAPPTTYGNELKDETITPWVRLTVAEDTVAIRTMGSSPRVRHTGRVFVSLFAAGDAGEATAQVWVDYVRAIFQNVSLVAATAPRALRLLAARQVKAGQDGVFWAVMIEVPFWYDERR